METALDIDPWSAVAIEVALIDGQRNSGDLNLADELTHSRLLGRCGVSEELTIFDEASQPIAAQAGNKVGGPFGWIDGSDPAANDGGCSSDPEVLACHFPERPWLQERPVHDDLQIPALEKPTIGVSQPLAKPFQIDPLIDLVDSDPDVTNLLRNALGDLL